MPAPVIYVVAAVGTVAAGFVFKQFVYDPYISPKVHEWMIERQARREARRNRNATRRTAAPHESYMHEDTTPLRGRDGRSASDSASDGDDVELESLRGSSGAMRRRTSGGSSGDVGETVLVSGLLKPDAAIAATNVTARRRQGANVSSSGAGYVQMGESTERISFPVMPPTPSYTTVSPPPLSPELRSSSPQESLSDSARFSVGSSTVASAAASVETLSARSPTIASPNAASRDTITSPPFQAVQTPGPRSPRSPASFNSLDSPQVQLPTPISPPRSPSQLYSSPLSSPPPAPGLGLTISSNSPPVSPSALLAPGLHAPAMSTDTRSFSSLSFNTALSGLDSDREYNHTSASSSQIFVDARSEASSRPQSPNEDMMYSFHSTLHQSPGPSNQSGLGGLSHAPLGEGAHRDDDLVLLSERDIFSDGGGSDGSWEEIAAQRDGWRSPPTRR